MTPIFLSYELSKMAAERGFEETCHAYWEKLHDLEPKLQEYVCTDNPCLDESRPSNPGYFACTAPTPFQLIEWLWEGHRIEVKAIRDFASGLTDWVVIPAIEGHAVRFNETGGGVPEALRAALELIPVPASQ